MLYQIDAQQSIELKKLTYKCKLMKDEPSCGHTLQLLVYHTASQSPKRCT